MKLKDIGTIITGNTPSKKNREYYESKDISFIKPSDIEEDYITVLEKSEEYISKKAREKARILPEGAILVTCIGTIGKVGILKQEASCNQQINAIIPNDKVIPKYLAYLMQSKKKILQLKANAPVVPIINKTDFSKIEINICDIGQQKQIVSQLDLLKNIIDKRKVQINELQNLVKSQFVEMFGDPILNEMKWNTDTINNVAPIQNYKGTFENKVWLLNLDMVESNSGRIINYIYEDIDDIGNSTSTFNEENILYSKLRPYLNKVVIPNKKGYATSELVPLKPNKGKLNRYFLAYLLRTEEFVKYISGKVAGAKMPRVSMDIFKKFNLILPPLELQNQFAEIVRQIDKQKFESMIKAKKEIEKIQKNIFYKWGR